MNVREQLHAIAEQIVGGRVFVDVTYRVSAERGPAVNYTAGQTAEAALATFIAELLEEQPERLARLAVAPPAESALAPAEVSYELAARANRPGVVDADVKTNKQRGVENRDLIRSLHQAGRSGPEIIAETGLASSCVYKHLKAIGKEEQAQPAAAERPVIAVRIGNGERWCSSCGESLPGSAARCDRCGGAELVAATAVLREAAVVAG